MVCRILGQRSVLVGLPAVDGDDGAVDEGGLAGEEQRDQCRDLLRLPEALLGLVETNSLPTSCQLSSSICLSEFSTIGVMIAPGAMALIEMPKAPYSTAELWVRSEHAVEVDRHHAVELVGSEGLGEVLSALDPGVVDADLTLPQFNVLMELAASPDRALPMHTVIDRLISTPSSLSWLTTRMRDRGLVTKERDDDDARVVLLAITEAGWAALEDAMPRVFATEKDLWADHRRADLRALATLLERLLD